MLEGSFVYNGIDACLLNATAAAMPPIPRRRYQRLSFFHRACDDLAKFISEDMSFWIGD
jgi:hypothetical protein